MWVGSAFPGGLVSGLLDWRSGNGIFVLASNTCLECSIVAILVCRMCHIPIGCGASFSVFLESHSLQRLSLELDVLFPFSACSRSCKEVEIMVMTAYLPPV